MENKLGKSSSTVPTASTNCSSLFNPVLNLPKASGYSKSAAINYGRPTKISWSSLSLPTASSIG